MKDADGENVSQAKILEGKDEEASFQAENSTNTEATLIGSEEKPEGNSDAAVEVKKEEKDNDRASDSDDLVGHGVEEVDNAKKEAETSAASKPAAEHTGEESKNQADASKTPVPQSEVAEKPKEDFEESSVQESESEASKKRAVSESVTEKAKDEVTEPSTVPVSISEEESKGKEPPIVSTAKGIETLGTEEGAKNSQDENKNFEETVALENTGEELKNQPNVSNTLVPQSEVVEKPKEDFEESSVQESESEASKKQAVSESMTEKEKGEVTEPSTVPSTISEEENKQKEPPLVSTAKAPASDGIETLGIEEGAKNSQDENKNFEETVALVNPGEELKNQPNVSYTLVPQNEVVEKPKEDLKESSVQESESEASTKQAVSKSVTEKVKGEVTEPSTVPSSISEKENKQKELPIVPTAKVPASDGIGTLGTKEGARNSQDENKNSEKTVALENLSEVVTDVAKLQEAGEGAVALEATDAPQKTDAELNASRDVEKSAKEEMGSGKVKEVVKEVAVDAGKPDPSAAIEPVEAADESSVIKIIDDSMKPEARVEEPKQEEIKEAEEPNLIEKNKTDAASEVADVACEGEKVSESTEKVEEKKNERLQSHEPTMVGPSKDLKATTEISEVSSEERKVSEGADIVEDEEEHLKSKEEITRDLDAASIVAEASSQEEKASKGAAVFEEMKDVGLKDEKVYGLKTSKDFDAASEVVEFSSQEKVSGIREIVAEKKEESLGSDKTTSIETSESSDAAAVSSKDEKSSVAVEMVDKKDNSLEGDKPTLVETSKDIDVVTGISGASLAEEKTSGGTKMVQEKDEKEKSPEGTETINEKKNEALEGARKTLGETFKEHDMAEKNVITASAAEPVADSEKIERDKEIAKGIAETAKPDDRDVVEPSKDGDVTKQDKEAPKQEVHKASRHHSSNILSKMKHLIVKAKKAILGKSPSSKTMSAGTKDDIKEK